MLPRTIKVRWTFRNIERIHKWLKIKSDMNGHFYDISGNYIGSKHSGKDHKGQEYLFFEFTGLNDYQYPFN